LRELAKFAFCNIFWRTAKMRSVILSIVAALAAQQVAGHATFQQLWVDGVDQIG
jgi:hypothetical protein